MTNAWLVWLLCALTGASIARFVHADKLMQPLRGRWEVHWVAQIDQVLNSADAQLQIARGSTAPEDVGKLRAEITRRAQREPGVSFWAHGQARERARPFSTIQARLDRLAIYSDFITCRWCVSPWVFLVAVLWTWGRVYGFSVDVFAPVDIPLDYTLISLVLGLRWVYALIDLRWGHDH